MPRSPEPRHLTRTDISVDRGDRLTLEEIARESGASVEQIREWVALGLIDSDHGTFDRRPQFTARPEQFAAEE